jgi:hypothetical protein
MKAKAVSRKKVAVPKNKSASTTKKKTDSPVKKKPISSAKRKRASTARKKPVPSAKKMTVSPSKVKQVSMAKEELELSNQVMEFATAAFKGRRIAYFVLATEKTPHGGFTVCVAIENEAGFYKLDWGWHCSLTKAKAETAMMNQKLGLTQVDVEEIIISTMLKPTYQ